MIKLKVFEPWLLGKREIIKGDIGVIYLYRERGFSIRGIMEKKMETISSEFEGV